MSTGSVAAGTFELPAEVHVVDSHTEGEPTRVVISGWPQPDGSDMHSRRQHMLAKQDELRRALLLEPRGFPAMVGALVTSPVTELADVGAVFFNNRGYLGMCGHGLMGVARTLRHLGRVQKDRIVVDTPAGTVAAAFLDDDLIEIENVPSYCHRMDVKIQVRGLGAVTGDVAYGGNWFFITHVPDERLQIERAAQLVRTTEEISAALREGGVTGADGAEIDHVELWGPPVRSDANSRNFVLCPGGEYDRSPCGTGTSARIATLHARGKLAIGEEYRQESISGSLFAARLEKRGEAIIPCISGRAFITGEGKLLFDERDPFRAGLGG